MPDETADDASPWLSPTEQSAWRAYLRASRLLDRALGDDLAEFDTQLTEYELLSMLSEAPEHRLRMSQLADLIVQSRSRVTHTASRLEGRGWVRRERAADDGRGVLLILTSSGLAAIDRMSPSHARSVRRHLVDLLSPQELTCLGGAMSAVRDHLSPRHRELGDG